jgi:putative transposase
LLRLWHGLELDILVQKRRDKAAAKRFFKRVLRSSPVPRKIVTDQLRSYPAAKAEIPELATVKHVFVKAAARLNNRAQNSHQLTRDRERRMRGFRDPKRTQKFLSCFGPATSRAQAAFAARFTLSRTTRSPVRCVA